MSPRTERPSRIQNLLSELTQQIDEWKDESLGSFPNAGNPSVGIDKPAIAQLAQEFYMLRRRRESAFEMPGLFGDPAWDILLDLFVAEAAGKSISITSACIGSNAPSTTALRYIRILERADLVQREIDATDHRRNFLKLTPKAQDMMTRTLKSFGQPKQRRQPLINSGNIEKRTH